MNRYDIALNRTFDRESAIVRLIDVLHQIGEKKKNTFTFRMGSKTISLAGNRNNDLWSQSPRFAHLPGIPQKNTPTIVHTPIDFDYSQFRPIDEAITPQKKPCSHPGCQLHVSHPCEVCGQQWPNKE